MKDDTLGVALVKEACSLCGKVEDGPIVMNTRLTKSNAEKVEAMHGQVIGYMPEPCDTCKDLMTKGFLLIGIIEEKSDEPNNPYRSGHQWVVTHDYADRLFDGKPPEKGACFIDVKMAHQIGLPVEEIKPKTEA